MHLVTLLGGGQDPAREGQGELETLGAGTARGCVDGLDGATDSRLFEAEAIHVSSGGLFMEGPALLFQTEEGVGVEVEDGVFLVESTGPGQEVGSRGSGQVPCVAVPRGVFRHGSQSLGRSRVPQRRDWLP